MCPCRGSADALLYAACLGRYHAGSLHTVEFVDRHKLGGRAERLHEISRIVRENGRWFYVDGDAR